MSLVLGTIKRKAIEKATCFNETWLLITDNVILLVIDTIYNTTFLGRKPKATEIKNIKLKPNKLRYPTLGHYRGHSTLPIKPCEICENLIDDC